MELKITTFQFTKKRLKIGFQKPTLFGQEIELKNQVKYLGVILDSKLNWNSHIETRLKKATIALWQCRKAIGKSWGLKPKVVYWIYTAIVRPILTYACVVWWEKAQQSNVIRKIGHLQRLACICITGSMRSTPTAALETLLMLMPLNIFIEKEARQVMYRLKCSGRLKNSRIGHSLVYDKMIKESPIIAAKTDSITQTNVFDRRFTVKFPPRELWMNQAEDITLSNEITCYTDGSFCDNRAGAGVFSETLNLKESYSLGAYTTVFQAEVFAILACSDICQRAGIQNETIHILSDSKAALMALSSYKITSSTVMQCWSSLQALSYSNRVCLSWVPGHCDIAGNEMADKLARNGSAATFCGPEPALPLSGSIAQLMTKRWAEIAHLKYWESVTTCRQSKLWLVGPHLNVTRYLLRLSRDTLRNLVSVITGHGKFRKHLHRMGLSENPLCLECGLEEETSFHFVCECPALSIARSREFGKPILNEREYKQTTVSQIQRFAARRINTVV